MSGSAFKPIVYATAIGSTLRIYEDSELPYHKGPLLSYDKPDSVKIPMQHAGPKESLPVQEAAWEEDTMMEEDARNVDLDLNDIF